MTLDENMNHENKTVIEQKQMEENSLDSSATFTKNLITNECTSTPIQKQVTIKHDIQSPKERINQHSKTLSVKLDAVNTTLHTIESSLQSFVHRMCEMKEVTDSIMPNIKQSMSESISSNLIMKLNKVREQIDSIVNKVSHCNSTIDSLHVKVNLVDSQLKESLKNKETSTSINWKNTKQKIKNLGTPC
ncbi:unnamed protein product [Mytilus coruscus]|uniref:Uncharacterized protein n=1 Tax=Mytilus coruscus TaxID=42192 RepID=A0A6J8ASG4_MYTCO|nr:unnamed protein product [Mytilus coruscus]